MQRSKFKLIHRIIATKKSYAVLASNQKATAYSVEKKIPLTIHSKIVGFVISFDTEAIKLFNARNNSKHNPSIEEKHFGLDKGPHNKELVKKFINYTMLFMRYYIYSCKLHVKPIILCHNTVN